MQCEPYLLLGISIGVCSGLQAAMLYFQILIGSLLRIPFCRGRGGLAVVTDSVFACLGIDRISCSTECGAATD